MERNAPVVFLSCVTEELGPLRRALARLLNTSVYKIVHQDDFSGSGDKLLNYLDEQIARSAAVVHLIGKQAARKSSSAKDWGPPKTARDQIVPLISRKLKKPHPVWASLSYTQWEAWLALYHGCRLYTYNLSDGVVCNVSDPKKCTGPILTDEVLRSHQISQQKHASLLIAHDWRIADMGRSSKARISTVIAHDLAECLSDARREASAKEAALRFDALRDEITQTPACDNSTDIRNLRSTRFYGREWLNADVLKWLNARGHSEPLFWLEAEAGFGKSTFCAQLGFRWKGSAGVNVGAALFLEPGHSPVGFVTQLCGQLRKACQAYRTAHDQALKRFSKSEVLIPSDLKACGDEQFKFAEILLEKLLIQPLRDISVEAGAMRHLIIVDGLDELIEWRRGAMLLPMKSILDRLFEVRSSLVRIMVTSRPARMYPILRELIETKQPRRKGLWNDEHEKERQDDAGKVVSGELAKVSKRWCERANVKRLVDKSRANMLYLHYVIADIIRKHLTPECISALPDGMAMYYLNKMAEYFPGDEFETTYVRHVKPCLELIAAGESTDLTASDIADCLGVDAVKALRASMHSMIVERDPNGRTFIVERNKYIEGKTAPVFEPFHMSFLDWLLGRPIEGQQISEDHPFRIFSEAGDKRIAQWCWSEYSQRKSETPEGDVLGEYWCRNGGDHFLNVFWNGFSSKRRSVPEDKYQHYTSLIRAVELLSWINESQDDQRIVEAIRPSLAHALEKTLSDRSPAALAKLESLDQDRLFGLYQSVSATSMVEQVILWIGSTQIAGWKRLVNKMLDLHDYVIRHAAASGQSARFNRLSAEGKRIQADKEVLLLLKSRDADHQEMGAYTVCDLAKEHIGKEFDVVSGWLKLVSKNERYFCQSMMGDLLIDLTLRNRHRTVEKLFEEKSVEPFWSPLWQYTELDVVSVLAQRKHRKAKSLGNFGRLQKSIDEECLAIIARQREIEKFQKSGRGSESDDVQKIGEMLNQTELSQDDKDFIVKWIIRKSVIVKQAVEFVTTESRIESAVRFLVLIFTHPLWDMCEEGAAILDLVSTNVEFQEMSIQILDRLIDSIDRDQLPEGLPRWRIILGTSESSFLLRRHDQKCKYPKSRKYPERPETLSRLEYCWWTYHAIPNCHVRALLAENVVIALTSRLDKKVDSVDVVQFLNGLQPLIRHWLADDDIWVLEHVYQLFYSVSLQQDLELAGWVEDHDAHVDSSDTLLGRASRLMKRGEWYRSPRGDFIDCVQSARKQTIVESPL